MLSFTIAMSRLFATRRDAALRRLVLDAIRSHLSDSINGLAVCRRSLAELFEVKDLHLAPQSAWNPLHTGPGLEAVLLPRPHINLSGWTSYLDSDINNEDEAAKDLVRLKPGEDVMILVEADESSDVEAFISGHQQWWSEQEKAVKLESLCRRVAWRVGPPFSIVLACSLLDLEKLIAAYLSDLLVTDDPLNINHILVVQAMGRPSELIRTSSAASFAGDRSPVRANGLSRPASGANVPLQRVRAAPPGPIKPPNIVVFDANGLGRAKSIIEVLRSAVDPESYTFHALGAAEWSGAAWYGSTAVLVCLCDSPGDRPQLEAVQAAVMRFTRRCRADAILLLPSGEEMAENELENVEEGWTKVESDLENEGRFLCLRDIACLTDRSRIRVLLASLDLQLRPEVPEKDAEVAGKGEPPVFVCSSSDDYEGSVREVLSAFAPSRLLRLSPEDEKNSQLRPVLPYVHREAVGEEFRTNFRFQEFRRGLDQSPIAITLVHSDTLTSSWTIMEGIFGRFKPNSGFVLSSFHQTEGKGRGQNAWISPAGQLQMTFHSSVHVSSPLGQCPSLVQHLGALSIVLAVKDALPNAGKLDHQLRVKWPNDIYWCRSPDQHVKLGGLLAKASITGMDFHFIVGMGLNVSNEKPTACLHQLLLELGVQASSLPSIESLMRHILLRFYRLKNDLESCVLSLDDFRALYEAHWMHGGQVVSISQPDGALVSNCCILGLDNYGYLRVRSGDTSETFSLHPDGNSFDLLANLIRPK